MALVESEQASVWRQKLARVRRGERQEPSAPPRPAAVAMEKSPTKGVSCTRFGRITGHKGRVFDTHFSPDGETVATVGEDSRLKLWSPSGEGPSECVADVGGGHEDEAMRVFWHPSGTCLYTGGADGRLCVWDLGCSEPRAVSKCSTEEIYGLQVLTPEMLLVGASNTVQQWDIVQQRQTRSVTLDAVDGAAVFGGDRNPDANAFVFGMAARGRMCAATLSDGTLRLVDAEECVEIAVIAAVRPSFPPRCPSSLASPCLASHAAPHTGLPGRTRPRGIDRCLPPPHATPRRSPQNSESTLLLRRPQHEAPAMTCAFSMS